MYVFKYNLDQINQNLNQIVTSAIPVLGTALKRLFSWGCAGQELKKHIRREKDGRWVFWLSHYFIKKLKCLEIAVVQTFRIGMQKKFNVQ